jgi:glucose-1-phosphate thymidylyltransferase
MSVKKGVLLAGGTGSRLGPLCKVTNKHLLPIYNKPMIFYPLQTLIGMGIKDILIVSGTEHCGHILQLLGSGKDFGVSISYKVQDEAGGIAQALGLAENFVGDNSVAVILGDNIFEDKFDVHDFTTGARLFIKETDEPRRFGVPTIVNGKIVWILEKPKDPPSNYAVTGLYVYDKDVFTIIRKLKPSSRGELEITDVNNAYIKKDGGVHYSVVKGEWTDAGTFESLFKANNIARNIVVKAEK